MTKFIFKLPFQSLNHFFFKKKQFKKYSVIFFSKFISIYRSCIYIFFHRACPECRQTSDYICPSRYWLDTPEEKDQLLTSYRANLLQKECKYFQKGQGECPFGNKCFYRHAAADGKDVDVGPPQKQVRQNDNGDPSLMERILLYDFLEERDGHLLLPLEIFDVLDFLSDSDESEWSMADYGQI